MKFAIALFCALFLVLVVSVCQAPGDEFTFSWDYEDGAVIDGFKLYSGHMGQFADGTWGAQYGDPIITGIPLDAREITTVENGWEGQAKKFCFKMRAFKGENESADSNEVCVTIDNTPLQAPQGALGKWDPSNNVVVLQWTQPDLNRTKYWQVYYKFSGETEYRLLDKLDNTGQPDLVLSKEITDVPAGESRDCIFTIVAYKDSAVFSPDSAEVAITIDRRPDAPIPPPDNFRLSVTIGVQ